VTARATSIRSGISLATRRSTPKTPCWLAVHLVYVCFVGQGATPPVVNAICWSSPDHVVLSTAPARSPELRHDSSKRRPVNVLGSKRGHRPMCGH
jgi:hypothetical protein